MRNSPASDDATLAVFLDLENIALGARDARYAEFDVRKVLERLLLKGHIVVKKAYCDFERYKDFKRGLHETAFEMIEIPHVRQSGKNSADIRMVVDALDLCYTKGHVDTFVIISGDSDFSPLVSKLRENAKTVIGVGVKNSTSDLFISNCDEFIYYDDLVRAQAGRGQRQAARSNQAAAQAKPPAAAPATPAQRPAGATRPARAVDGEVGDGASSQAALEARIEKQARTYLGERARSVEVKLDQRNATIRARGVKLLQRRGVRRTLEALPALSGLRTTIEVED